MTVEEFIQQLQGWRQRLIDDVIFHYHHDKEERGRLAFVRWKERFTAFLKEHVPSEASRFEDIIRPNFWDNPLNESPYDEFMREYGNAHLAFIDELIDSVQKGYAVLKPTLPAVLIPSSSKAEAEKDKNHNPIGTDISRAEDLYNKVRASFQNTKPLDQATAKLIIEYADDAIKELSNTNQEKKVELRDIKEKAGEVLPPEDFGGVGKGVQRRFLKKYYLKYKKVINAVACLTLVLGGVIAIYEFQQKYIVWPSPTPFVSTTPESSPDNCLERDFSYAVQMEAGSGERYFKEDNGEIRIKLTDNHHPVGALRLKYYVKDSYFEIEQVIDSKCETVGGLYNLTQQGQVGNRLPNNDTLSIPLGRQSYTLTLRYHGDEYRATFDKQVGNLE